MVPNMNPSELPFRVPRGTISSNSVGLPFYMYEYSGVDYKYMHYVHVSLCS